MAFFHKRKIKGAELVVTGSVLLASKFFLGLLAPLALTVYGLYRWLLKKSYGEGIFILACGIILWVLLKYTVFSFILWVPVIAGVIIMVYGAYLMFLAGDQIENKET